MNSVALYAAIFICLGSLICFIFGYFSIPHFQRKGWFDETGWFFGNIVIILLLSGSGYYFINNQNVSVFLTITICLTLGLIILPLTTQINWSH